jgi:glycosyltransferase involved in cell wall biosynthesis
MKVLYVTYDGLLDPLGQSQILPYLINTRNYVSSLRIISFEKNDICKKRFSRLNIELLKNKIDWTKLSFTQSQNFLKKLIDIFKLNYYLIKICISEKPDLIHARGHPMALICSFYKIIFKFKLLFDYRGIWADEKIAKGGWNLSKKTDLIFYKFFSKIEKTLIESSDHLVVLTSKVKLKILKETSQLDKSISVIPCACDYDLFSLSPAQKEIKDETITLGYLGSIGPAYRFDFFLDVISYCIKQNIPIKGLVITNNLTEANFQVSSFKENNLSDFISIEQTSREKIPALIHKMDYLLSFYKNFRSIIGTSPVKISEALACGVPIIANSGIGDIEIILKELNAGIVISDYSQQGLDEAFLQITSKNQFNKKRIRESSRKFFDLEEANLKYREAYAKLSN